MTAIHVEVGDRVLVPNDGLVHIVHWTNDRTWDSKCSLIIEGYQPDYYEELLRLDRDAMEKRHGLNFAGGRHVELELQRASDGAPTTCIQCLATTWGFDPRDPFSDVDE